jgi:hypothetical protein
VTWEGEASESDDASEEAGVGWLLGLGGTTGFIVIIVADAGSRAGPTGDLGRATGRKYSRPTRRSDT